MYLYKQIIKISPDELKGKVVLLRGSLNTPINDKKIIDTYRIKRNFETIKFLSESEAKVVLIGHLGKGDEGDSMEPISEFLCDYIPHEFIKTLDFKTIKSKTEKMKNSDVVLLENLRFFDGENENDMKFAKKLASLADIYVFDAFDVAHRKNASVALLPSLLDTYSGVQFEKEITELKKAQNPQKKSGLIFGGSKLETKIKILNKLLPFYDFVLVGGVVANTILSKKYNVGESLVDESVDVTFLIKNKKVLLPVDVVVLNHKNEHFIKKINKIDDNEKIVDVGPETLVRFNDEIKNTQNILWNGPLGWYEKGFIQSSVSVAKTVSSTKNIHSIAGGGDTIACIKASGTICDWSFISTGGGAMLYFLANDDLMLPTNNEN